MKVSQYQTVVHNILILNIENVGRNQECYRLCNAIQSKSV